MPGTFTRKDTDIGIHYARLFPGGQRRGCPDGQPNDGYCVPPGSPSLNNNNLVGNAINPVTYQGIRAEALYKFNEDWNLLVTQSYQEMNTQGVFYQQPNASDGAALAPLEVTLFNPAYDKDKFESTAWTLNGKLGAIKAVYTGGYLDAQRRSGRRLHQLFARRVCRLLPVLGAGRGERRNRPATRRARPGTRPNRTSTCRTSCASARRTTGVCAASPAPMWRTTSSTTRPPGCTRPSRRAPRTAGRAATPAA